MKIRKIKDLRKTNGGNKHPRNENQKRAATIRMIMDNPMKKEENRIKQSMRRLGLPPHHPFPQKNVYWALRKNVKKTEKQQIILDILIRKI